MENNIENWSEEKIKRRTFLSFGAFALLGLGGMASWRWFRNLPQNNNGLSDSTRDFLKFNEAINEKLFKKSHLAPTFPKELAAKEPRVNSYIGIEEELDLDNWQLEVRHPSEGNAMYFNMEAIKKLPKQEFAFEFKCIEGWSEIVNYGGTKFSDFLKKHNLGINPTTQKLYNYVGLETPDGNYYVGIDMKSIMHPQTLLCYELNGADLPEDHGAPLRLIIPIKYGVKNLKRIGKIFFSDVPPRDYWHENGYDYDCAL